METIIDIKNITFAYSDNTQLFKGISLPILKGEITGILGLNGAGKTTLLKIIMNLLDYKEGDIIFNQLVKFGYIPQKELMPEGLTLREYIMLGRIPEIPLWNSPTTRDYAIVNQIIAELNIDLNDKQFLEKLSGGELQIVKIARALAQNPTILIFDEPTTHLDINNRRKIHRVILDQKVKGKTVIIASNDINEILNLCNRILLLRKNGENIFIANNGLVNEKLLSHFLETSVKLMDINDKKYFLDYGE